MQTQQQFNNECIAEAIEYVFAMPEVDQPQAWIDEIEGVESFMKSINNYSMMGVVEVYKSIAREAKYIQ